MEKYPVITLGQFKGLTDSLLSPQKPFDVSDEANNVFFPREGGVESLAGRLQYNTTAIGKVLCIAEHSATGHILIADNNGDIYRLDGAGGFTNLATGKGTTNLYTTINFKGNLYFFNGIDTPFYYDGSTIQDTTLDRGKYVEVLWDRLIYAGVSGASSTVYMSEVYDHTPSTDYYAFPDEITGLSSLNGNLVVFTRKHIYLMIPYGNIFQVRKLEGSVGCLANGSIQKIDGGIIFLSDKGFYILTTEGPIPISAGFLDNALSTLSYGSVNKIKAVIDERNFLYMCALPKDGAIENSDIYIFNYLTKTWSRADVGYSYLSTVTNNNKPTVMAGSVDGYLYYENYSGKLVDRTAEWKTGWLSGKHLTELSRWQYLYLYLADISEETELSIAFYKDWSLTMSAQKVETLTPSGTLWNTFNWNEENWAGASNIVVLRIPINFISRSLSVGISGSKFKIAKLEVSYFPLGGGG